MATQSLLEAPVGPTVYRLASPMVMALVVIAATALIEVYWVGLLGSGALAAMGFVLPVTTLLSRMANGFAAGVTAVVARCLGARKVEQGATLAIDGFFMSLVASVLFCWTAIAIMPAAFRALGASGEELDLALQYVNIWLLGAAVHPIFAVASGIVRATGDTFSSLWLVALASLVNLALDPFFIFGLAGAPAWGVRGAAVANVLGYGIACIPALYLARRTPLFPTFWPRSLSSVVQSARTLVPVCSATIGVQCALPAGLVLLTPIVATFGGAAVAAFGIGSRLERLALYTAALGLGAAVNPMVAQNWGAGRIDRVRAIAGYANRSILMWGSVTAVVSFLLADVLSRGFTSDPTILEASRSFLKIVPLSFGPLGAITVAASVLTAVNRASSGTVLTAAWSLLVTPLLAFLGGLAGSLTGCFIGMMIANLACGLLGIWMMIRAVPAYASSEGAVRDVAV